MGTGMIRRLVFVMILTVSAMQAKAENAAEFYTGKQLRLIVGTPAGDGYDIWSRFLARHITRHLPGSPSIVVQNMPGAGTLAATNHLFNIAPRDGSTFASI